MSSGQPTTWFSGQSAPEDQPQGPPLSLMLGVGLLAYSPLGVIVLVGLYFAFIFHKITHKVIAAAAVVYTVPYLLFVMVFSSPGEVIAGYHAPFGRLLAAVTGGGIGSFVSDNWWFWLSSQLPLSLAIGLMTAAAVTFYKWVRRPAWETHVAKPGMLAKRRRKRAIEDIASDVNGPADGRTLGVTPHGVKVIQPLAEMAAHGLIAGGSGAGKTTTAMIGLRDAIRRGEPVCIVDLKGSADLPAQIGEWCERYGRRFLHWSIADPRVGYHGPADGPAFYDPIGRGDPSRKKDLLIGAEKWDVEYYKSVNEFYAQVAFQIAELDPRPDVDAFADLAALLDIEVLKQRACNVFLNAPKDDYAAQLAATQGAEVQWWTLTDHLTDPYTADLLRATARACIKPVETERSAVSNLSARVQKLRMSTAGYWLKRDTAHGRDIDLRAVADNGWVVVFSLDSSNYEATSAQIGGLIIQDLKTLSAELRVKPAPNPFHILLDEFSAIGSENIIGLLARARDARMPTMLSTQALGDLRKVDDTFLDQVLGIINYFILHRSNTEEDAEIFAGLTGKAMKYEVRHNVEQTSGLPGGMGSGAATGQGSITQVEDYVVPASAIQSLAPGEIVYIANAPKKRVVYPLTVVREDLKMVAHAYASGAKKPPENDAGEPVYVPEPTFGADLPPAEADSLHSMPVSTSEQGQPDWLQGAQSTQPVDDWHTEPTTGPPTTLPNGLPATTGATTLTITDPPRQVPTGLPVNTPAMPPMGSVAHQPTPAPTPHTFETASDEVPELDFNEPVRVVRPAVPPTPYVGDFFTDDGYDPELADLGALPDIVIPGVDDRRTSPQVAPPQVAPPQVAPPQVAPPQVAPPQVAPPQVVAGGGVFGFSADVDWEADAFSDES